MEFVHCGPFPYERLFKTLYRLSETSQSILKPSKHEQASREYFPQSGNETEIPLKLLNIFTNTFIHLRFQCFVVALALVALCSQASIISPLGLYGGYGGYGLGYGGYGLGYGGYGLGYGGYGLGYGGYGLGYGGYGLGYGGYGLYKK